MPTASINGLATGLDTSSIIQGLLAIDNQHVTDLQTKQSQVTAEQTAFQTIDAQLLALQAATTPLSLTQNSVFDGLTATSSDPTQVTAAASTGATPGVYSVQVNALATAQEIASQGFSDADAAVTQGTFQIQVGAGAAATVTVDGTNDTLQGLADAINNAGAGVTASVVNDGSGNDPYRLLLTSNQSGADNAIQITNNLAADGGGAVNPVFNSNYVGAAVTSASYNGTSTPTANTGAGGYTGTSNNTYTVHGRQRWHCWHRRRDHPVVYRFHWRQPRHYHPWRFGRGRFEECGPGDSGSAWRRYTRRGTNIFDQSVCARCPAGDKRLGDSRLRRRCPDRAK